MSNSYDDASTIDFLDENERPALDLVALHQRLEADGAAWRRTLRAADALLQRLARNGIRQREMTAADERMNARNVLQMMLHPTTGRSGRVPATISRVQGIAAVSAALVVVLLFGLLIHIFTGAHPADKRLDSYCRHDRHCNCKCHCRHLWAMEWSRRPHADRRAQYPHWTIRHGRHRAQRSAGGLRIDTISAQFAPHTRQWCDLAAALVAHQRDKCGCHPALCESTGLEDRLHDTVYVYIGSRYFTLSHRAYCVCAPDAWRCPRVWASWCDTYLSVNSGATWKILVLPEPGAITNGVASLLGVAQNPIQAQGKSLYALVTCSDCSGNGNNLMKSVDGGRSWKVTGPHQENVCAFSAIPDHTTIFAVSTAGPCGISNGSIGESSILRSDDGGAHWTLEWRAAEQWARRPGGDLFAWLGSSNALCGIAVGRATGRHRFKIDASAFFASVDGGQRWVPAPPNAATLPQIGSYATRIITSADGAIALASTEASGDAESTVLYTWKVGQQAWRAASRTLAAQILLASIGTNYWAAVITNGFQTTEIYKYES